MRLTRSFSVLIALYLAIYLAGGGLFSAALWRRGAHPTPDQWAYHLLLQGLGFNQHHGHTESVALPEDSAIPAVGSALATVPPPLQIIPVVPMSSTALDSTLLQEVPTGTAFRRRIQAVAWPPFAARMSEHLGLPPPDEPPRLEP